MTDISGVTFERGLDHNYMVIKGDEIRPSDYQVKMMTENNIMNILKLEIHMVDGHFDYYYEISSKQSIYSVYEHKQINSLELVEILECTLRAYRMAAEYMLDEEHLILNPKYIFMNPETMNMEFLFYPEYKASLEDNFCALSEFILDKVDHTDSKAVMLAYNLYKQIKSENYTLSDIRNQITQISSYSDTDVMFKNNSDDIKIVEDEKILEDLSEESFEPKKKSLFGLIKIKKDNQKQGKNDMKNTKSKTAFDTERELLENDEASADIVSDNADKNQDLFRNHESETINVGSKQELAPGAPIHKLIRKGIGRENIYNITGYPVIVGYDKKNADIYIKDTSIDKLHIRITTDNEAIFIQNISKDKPAFINEMQLAYEESIMLESGDDIRLGKVKLEYR